MQIQPSSETPAGSGESKPAPIETGRMIGGIFLSDILGKGGMGTVFKGVHSRLCVPVAVKVLSEEAGQFSEIIQEARLTAKINHPNIVRVYDVNVENNILYIVQELIDGESTHELNVKLAKADKLPTESRILEICADVARGLQAIHREGIAHLDIKPENILICRADGLAKIVDLGLASYFQAETKTEKGMIAGTPGFMSPERYAGMGPSFHDDLFGLGATFFELLTMYPAYTGKTMDEIYWQQANGPIPNPRRMYAHVSDRSVNIIAKCLQPERANRYPSAAALLDALLDARSRLSSIEPKKSESTLDPRFRSGRAIAHVLCVDDDASIGQMVQEVLAEEGHTVTVKKNGAEALEFLKTEAVDVVLTDVEMPRMNGLTFCRALREIPSGRDVPVVFLSGRNDVSIVREAMGMGAVDFLVKPMKLTELTARVRCLARLQQVNREQRKLTDRLNGLLSSQGVSAVKEEQPPEKPTVLIADDTQSLRDMLKEFLQDEGFEVLAVENGLEAVGAASVQRFDLCILDIDMPMMDGLEACRMLRTMPLTSQMPVLFLTTLSDAQTINKAFESGGTDFLTKPAHLHLLRTRVTNLLKLAAMTKAVPNYSKMISLMKG